MSVPRPAALADAGFLLTLGVTALLGLATTFTGIGFLVVGTVGLLVGLTVAQATAALRWPAISAVVIGLLAFVILGGPLCLRSEGSQAFVPGPATVSLLGDQVVFGWKDLLTTLPPVDGAGPLLVLPWLMGLTAGVLGGLLAAAPGGPRSLRAVRPLLAPTLLLAGVILLGPRYPQSLWLQGLVFAVLSLGWIAIRAQGTDVSGRGGAGRAQRLGLGAVLVAGAALLAQPLGTWASGSDEDRLVLRTYVEPPFDVGRYPSPLASFRRYVKMPEPADAVNLYDTTLLTLEGAPVGSRLRIASLDYYDGVVWGAANGTVPGTTTDSFQRVSSTIDNPVSGDEIEVRVGIAEGYSGVWLPTIGALQSVEFADGSGGATGESFRYNLATSTAVVPDGLGPGDTYSFTAVIPPDAVTSTDAPFGVVPDAASGAAFLDTQADQWSAGATEPMEQVFAVAEHLKEEGKYSDGVIEAEKIYHPGHYVRRLFDEFVNAPIMVGNDEQYAAVMALLANNLGVPARVVLGAVVPEGGVVQGNDIQAWVELQVADGSWRTLPTEVFMDTDRPAEQPPLAEEEMSGTVVPPPAPLPPPSTLAEQNEAELKARKGEDAADEPPGADGSSWLGTVLLAVGLPLLVVLLVVGTIIAAKAARRRRRRVADRMSARIVGAWRELVDHARDLGQPVPVGAGWTRREQSFRVASPTAPALARRADAHVFGVRQPAADEAAAYWGEVDAERRRMSRAVGRRRRLRAILSLRTFRRR